MSLAKRILGNTLIQFFGRLITALLAIVSVKLITHYLGVAGYGAYTTVYDFVGLFAIVGDMGLYTIAVREMAQDEQNEQKIYSNILTMRALFTSFVMVLVAIGGMFIPAYHDSLIPFGIWICTLVTWLNLFYSAVTSILQYRLKMHLATYALIIGKITSVAFIAYTAFFIQNMNFGFLMMIGSGIIGNAVMVFLSLYFTRKIIKSQLSFDWEYWKYLIKKAWPYGLALILSTIYFKIDVTMLSLMRNQTEVGYFGVALRMVEVLIMLPLFFMNSVLGTLTKAAKASVERVQDVFSLCFQFLFMCTFPIFIFVYFFARDLILLVASKDFLSTTTSDGSDSVLILLVFALVISFSSTLFSFTLVAFDKQKKVLIVNASGALFNIIINLIMIPKFGFVGSAITSIGSEILILFISFFLLQSVHRFYFDIQAILKVVFSGLVTFFCVSFLFPLIVLPSLIKMFLIGVLLCAVYGGLLIVTRAIDMKILKRFL